MNYFIFLHFPADFIYKLYRNIAKPRKKPKLFWLLVITPMQNEYGFPTLVYSKREQTITFALPRAMLQPSKTVMIHLA